VHILNKESPPSTWS